MPPTAIGNSSPQQQIRAHTTGSRLVLNTVANICGQALLLCLAFLSTPYITRQLGPDEYGALSLLMTYLFAFSLLNLGINVSLVKYLAELLPRGSFAEMQQYFSTALTVLVGVGVVIAAVISLCAGPIVGRFFNGPHYLIDSVILSLRIASVAFVLQFFAQVVSAVPMAAQRFEVINSVRVGSEALRVAATVFVVYRGGSLPAMLSVAVCSSLCTCVIYSIAAKKLIPTLSLKAGFSRYHLRSLLGHSRYILISNLGNHVVGSADSLMIGYWLPISNVAYYGIAFTIGQKLSGFVTNVVASIFPAASTFSGADRYAQLRELYLRGTKLCAAVVCFPACVVCLFSRQFLLFWLGPDYADHTADVLRLIVLGILINCLSLVANQVLQGGHNVRIAAKYMAIYALVNVSLYAMLIPKLGIIGAAAGFLGAQLLVVPLFLHSTNRLFGISLKTMVARCYAPVFRAAGPACFACYLCSRWDPSLRGAGFATAAGLAVYAFLTTIMVLDSRDKAAFWFLVKPWPKGGQQTRCSSGDTKIPAVLSSEHGRS